MVLLKRILGARLPMCSRIRKSVSSVAASQAGASFTLSPSMIVSRPNSKAASKSQSIV